VITKSVPARAHTRTFAVGVDYITGHTHQRAVAAAGVSFEGGVTYASAPEKAAWVHLRGVASVETAAIEMEAVAALSARCRDPVYHLIVAYAKHEHPTREQVVSDAERLLKAIGMDDHQYVLAAHKDTDDFHAHVIANRVGPDGRANDLWHERIIRERTCAEIAAERGWDIVLGHHNRDIVQRIEQLHDLPPEPEWRPSDGVYRRLHKEGELPWQDAARPYVLDAVHGARNWKELHERLRAHGVIVKLVRRGERVQGLAFAEGPDRAAPGCAASRIDARCALSALERRFGAFTPAHEAAPTMVHGVPWSDAIRPTILAAVDAARSWDELRQQLDQHGIVIKLVERGGRIQGLAFALGPHPDAPGCGASRIASRCKKSALEQRFGPFTDTEQHGQVRSREAGFKDGAQSRNRGKLRNRVEGEASADPRWALHEASRIANHARMRTAYGAYRDRFFADKNRAIDDRRKAAWDRESAQRQLEVQRRREARYLLRAVARPGVRGLVARQVAYWSIDAVIARRRAREYDAARVRWESTKIVLAAECGQAREEKPMDYRTFVAEKARTGDQAAQRVLDTLLAPAGRRQHDAVIARTLSLADVRARLDVIRAEQEARYDHARAERGRLQRVAKPPALNEVVAAERARIARDVVERARLTDAERARLAQLSAEKRSWNPFTRAAAAKAETQIRVAHQSRQDLGIAEVRRQFEERDVPQIAKRVAEDGRRYRAYVSASLGLEQQMRDARTELRDRIPRIEHQVNVLERSGASAIVDYDSSSGLNSLAAAVSQQYRALPDTIRRDVESAIRRDHRDRDRARESVSM
jgi:Relaxase/Mobilisation nuclease domain